MAELKTRENDASVEEFLDAIPDETQRAEARLVDSMMREVTGCEPKMWGPSIVGYGKCNYRYESGRTLDWPLVGFSPRKKNLTLYLMQGFADQSDILSRLGKYSTGKGCLWVRRLADVDMAALRELTARAVEHAVEAYGRI